MNERMQRLARRIGEAHACPPACAWLSLQTSPEQAWRTCRQGDWLLWIVMRTCELGDDQHRGAVRAALEIIWSSLCDSVRDDNRAAFGALWRWTMRLPLSRAQRKAVLNSYQGGEIVSRPFRLDLHVSYYLWSDVQQARAARIVRKHCAMPELDAGCPVSADPLWFVA